MADVGEKEAVAILLENLHYFANSLEITVKIILMSFRRFKKNGR
jgi:hypothetical protein